MKVELKKEINQNGDLGYYVYVDNWAKDCFTTLKEAEEYYDNIKTHVPCVEILKTKEV